MEQNLGWNQSSLNHSISFKAREGENQANRVETNKVNKAKSTKSFPEG